MTGHSHDMSGLKSICIQKCEGCGSNTVVCVRVDQLQFCRQCLHEVIEDILAHWCCIVPNLVVFADLEKEILAILSSVILSNQVEWCFF